jgi:hypothetical protein
VKDDFLARVQPLLSGAGRFLRNAGRTSGRVFYGVGIFAVLTARGLRKIFKKDSLPNLVLVTTLISVAVAIAVAVVHDVTAPRIEAGREEAFMAALGTVFPGEALHFQRSSLGGDIYEGRGEDGLLAGFSVLVSARGHAGIVRMVVGIDIMREVTGVTVVSHRELGDLTAVKKQGVISALALLDGEVRP